MYQSMMGKSIDNSVDDHAILYITPQKHSWWCYYFKWLSGMLLPIYFLNIVVAEE